MWEIRSGREEDVDAVLALEQETENAPHWARREYAGIFTKMEGDEPMLRRMFVATSQDGIVGFSVGIVRGLWGRTGDRSGELESVAVAVRVRRSGIGRALCVAVLQWCRAQGGTEVELEVRSVSQGAVRLYRSLGFEAVGVRRRYYTQPEDDALLMRVRL